MENKIYQCKMSKNRLEFRVDKEKAIMDYVFFDEPNIRPFFLLLRQACVDLTDEKIKTLVQLVTDDDWENFLKENDKWKLVSQDAVTKLCTIECNMEDALENIAKGFGVHSDKIVS